MASSLIHMSVAKEIGKRINKRSKDYYLGSIAPDIAKQIGLPKGATHFQYAADNVPNIDVFLDLYRDDMKSDYTLGYFIHLYTDKMWFDGFIDYLVCNDSVKLRDGTLLRLPEEEITKLIYNDYTNMNISLLDKYELDLSLIYEDYIKPVTKVKEADLDKMPVLLEQMGRIIENSKNDKKYIFNMNMVNTFIKDCTNEIIDYLTSNNLLN